MCCPREHQHVEPISRLDLSVDCKGNAGRSQIVNIKYIYIKNIILQCIAVTYTVITESYCAIELHVFNQKPNPDIRKDQFV